MTDGAHVRSSYNNEHYGCNEFMHNVKTMAADEFDMLDIGVGSSNL